MVTTNHRTAVFDVTELAHFVAFAPPQKNELWGELGFPIRKSELWASPFYEESNTICLIS